MWCKEGVLSEFQGRGYPQTPGRGAKPSDIKALEELLLRVSAMVEDFPRIREMDLNPLKSLERGYTVVDARIMLS
ncbi:MAG: acetate--CoA ligase family protein [Chloroflexi bacterium]|nr:acetate--CoA ligase family protein [Chloroflexota bacterium]